MERVLGGLGRIRDVGHQSNESFPQEECRSLSWWGRKRRQEVGGGISYQEDTVVLSQESLSFRGSWSVWLPTMWSVWGCGIDKEYVIPGVWSGQSQCGVDKDGIGVTQVV